MTRGTLIDLTGVAGLDRVQADGAWIHVGANVTYAQLADHPLVQADLPCLAQMAEQVGSAQIRNMARLPGNLANASPGGDAIPLPPGPAGPGGNPGRDRRRRLAHGAGAGDGHRAHHPAARGGHHRGAHSPPGAGCSAAPTARSAWAPGPGW